MSNGDFASMVDARLYLPEGWCTDSVRCDEAGIPEDSRDFKTKWEIAIEIITHQKSLGVDFDYVGGDGYYGNSWELAEAKEDMGYVYMLDIHSNLRIYLENAEIGVPPFTGKPGRKPTKERSLAEGIRVDKYMSELTQRDWKELKVCNMTKRKLTADYYFRRVYVWNEEEKRMLSRLLVIRRTKTKKGDYEYKYSFTNANQDQFT